ncbi:MAG: hypothetical protein U1E65_10925 [Myxococcota bacterium]
MVARANLGTHTPPLVAALPALPEAPAKAPEEPASRTLPRTHVLPQKEPETRSGFIHRISDFFHRHQRSVSAVMMGATSIPSVLMAGEARADPLPTAAPTTASTTPTAAPVTDPTRVQLTADTLFSPRPSALSMRSDELGYGLDQAGHPQLLTVLPDGRRVNLLPTAADVLRWSADGSLSSSTPRTPRARVTTDPAFDALLAGVPGPTRDQPWNANFDDYVRARAALGEVPTALAGMALRPVANKLYEVVDHIPAPIRRPFDRSLGLLLDNAVSIPANLMTAHVFMEDGALPSSVNLNVPGYTQMRNSCGETMVATWLKDNGYPIALGEVDTQMSFFEGGNLLEDSELRTRGFSIISGPSSFNDLKTYLAHGYPVLVNVGWEGGGGHYAVATGYDEATHTLKIDNWHADGQRIAVPYQDFQEVWGRHKNLITVVYPQADARLSALRTAGKLSRTAPIQEGVSLSDIWVTQRLEFFVEAAYRYRGTADDFTVRLNTLTPAPGSGDRAAFGGSVRYAHRFQDGTEVNVYAERLPTRSADPETIDSILRTTSIYGGVRHGPFSARVGYERESFQARLQAELNNRLGSVGAEARVAVGLDGNVNVFIGASGTF